MSSEVTSNLPLIRKHFLNIKYFLKLNRLQLPLPKLYKEFNTGQGNLPETLEKIN